MTGQKAGVAAVGLFFMPLAILAGPQTPAWDKVDLTDSAAVRKYVAANPNVNSHADATLALELHRRISRIRSGQVKSQLALMIADIDPRFIQTDGDDASIGSQSAARVPRRWNQKGARLLKMLAQRVWGPT